MSYDRMVRAESELAGEVEALLAEAERLDAAEDAAYGLDRRGDELPVELTRREGRLAAIRAAKAALEAEHAARARAEAEEAATNRIRMPTRSVRPVTPPKPPRLSRTGRSARSPTRTRGS
jgi:hypothetical protein